jgi:DNA mismatch endonuclease (patch repair protein)
MGRRGRTGHFLITAMVDVFTSRKRSKVMARIRSSGNKDTELKLVAMLREHRVTGWRRGWPLLGKPDFVFARMRVAVFVDGCFWHGCHRHGRVPASNRRYWFNKLIRNKTRDRAVTRTLRSSGWRVLRIWEHELTPKNSNRLLQRIRKALG